MAQIEYPGLDPTFTRRTLDQLGERAALRLALLDGAPVRARLTALSRLLFDDEGFSGNRDHYGDFRNSLLNVVVERRVGIPISLGLVYAEVARRAGIDVLGVSFPGHFLLRVPDDAREDDDGAIILDPFDRGRELNELECHALLERHVGEAARFNRALLGACTRRQWLTRMLNNLKRIYIELRSFPHAHQVTELLYAIDPTADVELRDRGLLAYHLDDYPAALRDLERYLSRRSWSREDRDEHDRVMEHVKNLRSRVAGLN